VKTEIPQLGSKFCVPWKTLVPSGNAAWPTKRGYSSVRMTISTRKSGNNNTTTFYVS